MSLSYHYGRTHYSLVKDTPCACAVQHKPVKGWKVQVGNRVGNLKYGKRKGTYILYKSLILLGSGARIRTWDLRVMSPTSYLTAPPRVSVAELYI